MGYPEIQNNNGTTALSAGHYRTAHIISRDTQIACLLNRVLYLNDYSCLLSCNPESAELNLRLLKADLIIIDNDTERGERDRILSHIRALHPSTPLLMLVSHALEDEERKALAVLPQWVLIKPVQAEYLYSLIGRLFQPALQRQGQLYSEQSPPGSAGVSL